MTSSGNILNPDRVYEALRAIAQHHEDIAHELRMLSQEVVGRTTWEQKIAARLEKHRETSIDELELSVRATNCLRGAGITTIGQLARQTPKSLRAIKHFGRRSQNEVLDLMRNIGLPLQEGVTK